MHYLDVHVYMYSICAIKIGTLQISCIIIIIIIISSSINIRNKRCFNAIYYKQHTIPLSRPSYLSRFPLLLRRLTMNKPVAWLGERKSKEAWTHSAITQPKAVSLPRARQPTERQTGNKLTMSFKTVISPEVSTRVCTRHAYTRIIYTRTAIVSHAIIHHQELCERQGNPTWALLIHSRPINSLHLSPVT